MIRRASLPLTTFALIAALLIVLIAAVAAAPGRALAQAAPSLEVIAVFDPPSATIGDRVTYTVHVTHPAEVVLKATAPKIEHVDLVTTIPPATVVSQTGPHVTTFAYTLQPFLLGTVDTGTMRLAWLRNDGTTGNLDVPGATLIVSAVRAADDLTPRPLKPQVSILGAPPAWLRPSIAAGAVLAIIVAVVIVTRIVRGRRTPAIDDAPPPPMDMTPEGIARRALDAIAVHGRPDSLDYQSYYGGLALTVRTYLAARFGFNAHALTTRELERRMVSNGVDRWQARLVAGLLERCDNAVYARRYPELASADHDLTVAYEIVELSRPRSTTEDSTTAGRAAPA